MLRFIILSFVACFAITALQSATAEDGLNRANDEAIVSAYQSASGGFSTDEIIIRDDLRTTWLAAVASDWSTRGDDWQTQTLLRLLSLRKAGKLPAVTNRRGPAIDDSINPIAEIAARGVLDEHNVSSDELLCDPRLRKQLQVKAASIVPEVDPYAIRKAVLRLRKTRQLRPELTLRVADWHRSIDTFSRKDLEAALKQPDRISRDAGVYLFRDATGYLYIGEANNLHQRLTQHLHDSDRLSLRSYLDSVAAGNVTIELHLFGPESPANQLAIRRAYESELIRSREPRLNVRP